MRGGDAAIRRVRRRGWALGPAPTRAVRKPQIRSESGHFRWIGLSRPETRPARALGTHRQVGVRHGFDRRPATPWRQGIGGAVAAGTMAGSVPRSAASIPHGTGPPASRARYIGSASATRIT